MLAGLSGLDGLDGLGVLTSLFRRRVARARSKHDGGVLWDTSSPRLSGHRGVVVNSQIMHMASPKMLFLHLPFLHLSFMHPVLYLHVLRLAISWTMENLCWLWLCHHQGRSIPAGHPRR